MKEHEEKTTLISLKGDITARLPKAKDACLVMLYGPDLGKRYILSETPLLLGRTEKAQIFVDRESVSRHHARVYLKDNLYYAEDLGSTNGTFVNDLQIQRAPLADGDRLRIGEVIFKFLSQDNLENIYHEELYRLATTDGLTMVHNKRFFLEHIEREFSRAKRYGRSLSLILMDLDFFKNINDSYGHLAGDHVLKSVAKLARHYIRKEDILARYGGEEFALLLPETNLQNAIYLAEKIRLLIENKTISYEDRRIHVTLSIGVATTNSAMSHPLQLIKEADNYLYHSKRMGRNRVSAYKYP